MNIQFFTPILSANTRNTQNAQNSKHMQNVQNFQQIPQNVQNSHYSNTVMPSKLSPLKADNVSFGSSTAKIANSFTTSLKEAFSLSYDTKLPKREIMANKLIDTVCAISEEIPEIEFLPSYRKTAIKGKNSYFSKMLRSGGLPQDPVRTTGFTAEINNFSVLNMYIKKMAERGYEIRMIPAEKSGRKVLSWMPDVDIRLANVSENEIKKLPKIMQRCVSDRLPSGLQDIQLRFIDKTSKCEEPIEVILMVGKKTGQAKVLEEDDVYSYLRVLKNELHVSQVKNFGINSPIKRIKDNVSIITDYLRNYISKPLYQNAEHADLYGEYLGLPVGVPKSSKVMLQGLLEGIRSKIGLYYSSEIAKVKENAYQKEIERMIKASPEFKERGDKTIYIEDILKKRDEMLNLLESHKNEDMEKFRYIQKGLKATIGKDYTKVLEELFEDLPKADLTSLQ